jgi:hypothetical protein
MSCWETDTTNGVPTNPCGESPLRNASQPQLDWIARWRASATEEPSRADSAQYEANRAPSRSRLG